MKQLVSQWHLFKVNNENTRTTCEIGKGTWATSMTGFTHCFDVSVVDFEQVNTVLVVSIQPANIQLSNSAVDTVEKGMKYIILS